jgi:hypothetical protein
MNQRYKKESILPNLPSGEWKTSPDCGLFQIKTHSLGIASKTGIM